MGISSALNSLSASESGFVNVLVLIAVYVLFFSGFALLRGKRVGVASSLKGEMATILSLLLAALSEETGKILNGLEITELEWSDDKMKYMVKLDGVSYEVEIHRVGEQESPAPRTAPPGPPSFMASNPAISVVPQTSRPAASSQAPELSGACSAQQTVVNSPMPGIIQSVTVSLGDCVRAGQVLVVIEAMKMENEIVSPIDATVEAIHVKEGHSVEAGALMLVLH